jgi:uncharacterized protein (TIGR03435 family)
MGLLPNGGLSQARKAAPAFESAEIRASLHLWNSTVQGGLFRTGKYELRQATVMDLIKTSYTLDADTIFGGPPWLDWDRFDITAKAPPGTSQENAKLMLRNLLADRFQLSVHEDKKAMPAFVLSRGRGQLKLKRADVGGNPGCRSEPPQKAPPGVPPFIAASCRGLTMDAFADILRGLSAEYVQYPVVNTTGLEGAWDFDLQWTPRGPLMGGRGGTSLFDAMDSQLGIHLEAHTMPLPVLVVDSVNRRPRENPAGGSLRGSDPIEFEVASVRANTSDDPPTPPPARQYHPGGRLTWRAIPLRDLVKLAWDLDPDPHAVIVGAPKSMDAHFDILAKAPAGTMASPTQIFADDLQKMLRALLIDRFKMRVHFEDRQVEVYTLVANKPKLKPADPSTRPGCRMAPPQPRREPGEGQPPRVAVCRNVTMEQFANSLQEIARSYIRYPVVDGTGLQGAWDFTLRFHPAPPPHDEKKAMAKEKDKKEEEGPRISIFSAIDKQLGLKLQPQKRAMPVLVIDHIEEKPTEN